MYLRLANPYSPNKDIPKASSSFFLGLLMTILSLGVYAITSVANGQEEFNDVWFQYIGIPLYDGPVLGVVIEEETMQDDGSAFYERVEYEYKALRVPTSYRTWISTSPIRVADPPSASKEWIYGEVGFPDNEFNSIVSGETWNTAIDLEGTTLKLDIAMPILSGSKTGTLFENRFEILSRVEYDAPGLPDLNEKYEFNENWRGYIYTGDIEVRIVDRHGTTLMSVSESMGYRTKITIVERDQYGNPLLARVEKDGVVSAVGEKRWTYRYAQ